MQIFRPGANTIATLLLASLGVMPVLAVGLGYQIVRLALCHGSERDPRSAGTVQPRTPCRRPRARLPLLPHLGGEGAFRRTAADRNLHDLPLPALDQCRHAGAGAREPGREQADPLAARQQAARTTSTSIIPFILPRVSAAPPATGPIGQMKLTRQAAPLTMNWCIDCHRDPAKALRPREAVFDPDWKPTGDRETSGQQLMAAYHIRTDHLTDCSICHR